MDSLEKETLQLQVTDGYVLVAVMTLWIEDYLETLPTEIQAIWSQKHSGASILFILNRYTFLLHLSVAVFIGLPGKISSQQCQTLSLFVQVLEIITNLTTTFLFALRVYAIYGKSKVILAMTICFMLLRISADVMSAILEEVISFNGELTILPRCGIQYTGIDIRFG
ncbi:hypothetical protein GYMLUDRAFT_937548 [Collybiopsis luxurians FD-317 M1]|uniref:DUF6533 domain-containing protein n=1 Tax=Collybiopsis luxurians FD-317 M1 TaxID=944289 RepID=A0A0D0BF67_9AGAR|nr:hypothetical protein GYMLUDRAFT_937548 [Collybiopsis luxurians FD-317 M1]